MPSRVTAQCRAARNSVYFIHFIRIGNDDLIKLRRCSARSKNNALREESGVKHRWRGPSSCLVKASRRNFSYTQLRSVRQIPVLLNRAPTICVAQRVQHRCRRLPPQRTQVLPTALNRLVWPRSSSLKRGKQCSNPGEER